MENKQLIANKICEALQQTRQFAPNRGHNGLLELRYIERNGGEYLRPIFEDNLSGNNDYCDINITGDSGTAMFVDVVKQFIKRFR